MDGSLYSDRIRLALLDTWTLKTFWIRSSDVEMDFISMLLERNRETLQE